MTEEEDINSLAVEKLQPLGLMRALLRLRDWRAARELMLELDGVDVAAYPAVAEALCDLLEWVTAPAYATHLAPRDDRSRRCLDHGSD